MPEIAEVHLNTDLILKKYLKNEKLKDINIISGKYIHKKPTNFSKFIADLPANIISINNRGKFIWIELDNDWFIGIGFGMTGRFSIHDEKTDKKKNTRITMISSNDVPIHYIDARNFGNWNFWKGRTDLDKKLKDLGYDVLIDDDLPKKTVVDAFRKHDKWEISKALLSQKILAGPGNYIRAESLYDAKIYPYAKVSDLSDADLYKLYKSVVKIAKAAYIAQKKNFEDDLPYEQYQEKMKIYNKTHDPLGNEVTRGNDTRTTWYVKEIQTIGKK